MANTDLPPLPANRAHPLDPPPEYKQLRLEQPILKVRTPRGDPAWLVTRLEDIRAILTDKRFSSDPRKPGYPTYITGDVPPPPGFFMQHDAPDHTRLRRMVTDEFKARHVEGLRPRMQQIVDQRLDAMLMMAPPVDLVKVFAVPVASMVICELLGVSLDDYPFVQSRTDIVLDRSRSPQETTAAAIELMGFFDRLVTAKEQNPTPDDLIGRVVLEAARRGQPSHQELVGLSALLLLGGYDTMAQVIGLGTVTLLKNPDQLAAFLQDPALSENLVDELVRYLSVNHAGLPRAALADVEVGGQLIRAGEGVIVMLNSGNRDELAFKNPDAFDIQRQTAQHVGFGHGLHKCIGADFARAELDIVFRSLFQRVPTLALAAPMEELPFRHEMVLYGLNQLPVSWSEQAANERLSRSMKIIAISGSLRKDSSNTKLLHIAAMLAPEGVEIPLYQGLAEIPPFNPDLDEEGCEVPPPVKDLREQFLVADGVLISCPEYAHGVPGALKNALDWLVSCIGLSYKPVTLLNPSPRSVHAQASLMETLRTMSWVVVPDEAVLVPLSSNRLLETEMLADPVVSGALRSALQGLVRAIETSRACAEGSALDLLPKGGYL